MSSSRRPIMAGNWKMHKTTGETVAFLEALHDTVKPIPKDGLPVIVIAPPFTALEIASKTVQHLNAPFLIAAQTMDSHEQGAYTGEISVGMLKDLNVNPVIIGHSERRQYFNETDASVNAKTLAALNAHITPIVCVGETLAEREAGKTDAVIRTQVTGALKDIPPEQYEHLVFAYEPVWAIGTGKTCEADEANRVCALIRGILNESGSGELTRILYGGSVKPENIQSLMAQSDIDGGLVGGASLEPDSFLALIRHSFQGSGIAHV